MTLEAPLLFPLPSSIHPIEESLIIKFQNGLLGIEKEKKRTGNLGQEKRRSQRGKKKNQICPLIGPLQGP